MPKTELPRSLRVAGLLGVTPDVRSVGGETVVSESRPPLQGRARIVRGPNDSRGDPQTL